MPLKGSFAAAAFSGVVKSTCTYPLDLIKTTIQLQKKANIQHQRQGTIFNTGADIIRRKGVTALYVGWTTSLIQQVGKVGIQFSAFEFWYSFLQSAFTQYNNSFENIENKHSILTFSAGLFAGATEAIIWTTPTERLKIIQQAELREGVKTREHRGFVRALTNIIKTHGVSNLFVGVVPTAIRQGSSLGIRFLLFSTLKQSFETLDKNHPNAVWHTPIAAGSCGVISVMANNPIDVIKTRIQSQYGHNNNKSSSLFSTLKDILKKEGVSALYKGVTARAMKVGFGQIIVFSGYTKLYKESNLSNK